MKTKCVNTLQYDGLGFPVEIHNVEMLLIDGEWHPKIDVRKVADIAIEMLLSQSERFSGNQIRFIRAYFSMSLRVFADKVVRESHTAVTKWEKCGDNMACMDINIEKIVRLYIYQKVVIKRIQHLTTVTADFYDQLLEPEAIVSKAPSTPMQMQADC